MNVSRVLAVVGTALCLAAGPAAAAAASSGDDADAVTWGVRTAATDHGADRDNFRYTLDPGSELADELVVTNHGDDVLRLDVYAADGYTTSAGQLDVLTRDTTSTGVGAWLVPGVEQVRLAPGESADVPFTLRVPDDATPGDHAGAILTSRTVSAQDSGLDYETRSGIRVHVRVAGTSRPASPSRIPTSSTTPPSTRSASATRPSPTPCATRATYGSPPGRRWAWPARSAGSGPTASPRTSPSCCPESPGP
nr:hypothetical protein GCM10025730_50890 [Promicromonospora thailandica]